MNRPPKSRSLRSTVLRPFAAATKQKAGIRTAALLLLAPTVLLSGCGGASPTPTQAQFASRANAICAAALRNAARVKAPRTAAEVLPTLEQASSIVSKTAGELQAVKPPASQETAFHRFLATIGHETQLLGAAVDGLRNHNTTQADRALQGLNFNYVNEQAKALGLSECARNGTPSKD